MVLADGHGILVAAEIHSNSPAEVNLIKSLLDHQPLPQAPRRPIYDRTADSDPLQDCLEARGIDPTFLIDRIEQACTTSWTQNFHRLIVRYEYPAMNFLRFGQLTCLMIVMRKP